MRHVLILDDSLDFSRSLGLLLYARGFVSTPIHQAVEVLTLAERLRPEVIILDIATPALNGYETCQALRAEAWGHSMLLIAHSPLADPPQRRRALLSGFDFVYAKADDPVPLAIMIVEALSRS